MPIRSKLDKFSIQDVEECIHEVGKVKASVFSTLDLRSSFLQMQMDPASSECTSFTIPGQCSWEWVVAPFGLSGCPGNVSRIMHTVLEDLPCLSLIDDTYSHMKKILNCWIG